MNLVASSKPAPASTLANAGPLFSGLAIVWLAIFLGGSLQCHVAAPFQNSQCLIEVRQSSPHDGSETSETTVRYESELTGFAEIDAPGRQTPSARVVTTHRCAGNSVPDDDSCSGLPQNRLILDSQPALPIADSRPSLQDFEIRLQI